MIPSRRQHHLEYIAQQLANCSDITVALVAQLVQRDQMGRAKYGTTLDRTDLTLDQWLQHQVEELLDGAGYALAAMRTNQERQPSGADEYLAYLEAAIDEAGFVVKHDGGTLGDSNFRLEPKRELETAQRELIKKLIGAGK